LANSGSSKEAEGFLLLGIEIEGGGDLFEGALLAGHGLQEILAIVEPLRCESIEELQSRRLPLRE
jgi:hypothetical protein